MVTSACRSASWPAAAESSGPERGLGQHRTASSPLSIPAETEPPTDPSMHEPSSSSIQHPAWESFLLETMRNRNAHPKHHPALGQGVACRILFQCQDDGPCDAVIAEVLAEQQVRPSAVQIWPLAASMALERLDVTGRIPLPIKQLTERLHAHPLIRFAECDRAFQPVYRQQAMGPPHAHTISRAQLQSAAVEPSWEPTSARHLLASDMPADPAGAHRDRQSGSLVSEPIPTSRSASAALEAALAGDSSPAAAAAAAAAASGAAAVVDDPIWPAQWDRRVIGLTDRDASGGVGPLQGAWETATDAPGVIVCITDSGIDYNHPDLAANMWTNPGEVAANGVDDDSNGVEDDVHGYNAVDNNGEIMDTDSHGTHTAGIVGAVANNGVGITGIAQKV